MSKLRPECKDAGFGEYALPDDTALFLIRESVAKRRELIYGRLHNGFGDHCAIGAFWADNPTAVLNSRLIDEVAAVNDSVPKDTSPHERWKKVNSWLRFKIASLARRRSVAVIAIAVLLFGSVCMADTLNLGAPGPISAGTVLTLPVQLNVPVQGTDTVAIDFAGASFTSTAPVDIGLIMYTTGDPCGGFASGWGTLSGQAPLQLGEGCGYTIVSGVKIDPWIAVGLVGADASGGISGMTLDMTLPNEPGISITSASFLIGFSGDGDIVAAPAPVSTPEPSTWSLLLCGLGLAWIVSKVKL